MQKYTIPSVLLILFYGFALFLSSLAAGIRFYFLKKVKSKSVFFKLMFHHTFADVLFCISRIPLFILYISLIQSEDANDIETLSKISLILVMLTAGITLVFTFHFSLSAYLQIERIDLYNKYYIQIVLSSYMAPLIAAMISLVGYLTNLKMIVIEVASFLIPLLGCLCLLIINIKILLRGKEYNLNIDYKNLIILPLLKGMFWTILLTSILLSTYQQNQNSNGNYAVFFASNLIYFGLTLFPFFNFILYFRLIYREYKMQDERKTVIEQLIEESDRANNSMISAMDEIPKHITSDLSFDEN